MAKVAKKVVKRRRERKNIEKGAVHISATFNNTIITVTDVAGNAISWASAGELGFKVLSLLGNIWERNLLLRLVLLLL